MDGGEDPAPEALEEEFDLREVLGESVSQGAAASADRLAAVEAELQVSAPWECLSIGCRAVCDMHGKAPCQLHAERWWLCKSCPVVLPCMRLPPKMASNCG